MKAPGHEGDAIAGAVRAAAHPASQPGSQAAPLPADVIADLRTDHAGETGAVCIYLGVLRVSRDPALRRFALRHLATERSHLMCIDGWLPATERSRLLPLWRLSGWLTGALPALLGPRAVYATIEAVERFVDEHYGEQIDRLRAQPGLRTLHDDLERCRADEVHHRDEAAQAAGDASRHVLLRAWTWIVDTGSRGAVSVCRRI